MAAWVKKESGLSSRFTGRRQPKYRPLQAPRIRLDAQAMLQTLLPPPDALQLLDLPDPADGLVSPVLPTG